MTDGETYLRHCKRCNKSIFSSREYCLICQRELMDLAKLLSKPTSDRPPKKEKVKLRYIAKQNKTALIRYYGKQCFYCRKKFPTSKLTIDHFVPLSRGGSNDISNLRLSCYKCNELKGSTEFKSL